ncbi:Ionotropic receptor 101 [Hyalella azteca]|uniref:Ionotropic receptor 101 n=1 Tax=Hyalella azteca TaxID=294128 RepID=A0A6A0GSM7_HYAAZ|nr:Ionotropic receptor 101 [Hyalella azteca]
MQHKLILVLLIVYLHTSRSAINRFVGINIEQITGQNFESFQFVFGELVWKILDGENLLLVLDPALRLNESVSGVIDRTLANASTPRSLLYWDAYNNDKYIPREFIRGGFMGVVLLFQNDPYEFFIQLASSWIWNPEFLVLFSLNGKLDHETITKYDVVQRSQFIILIKPSVSNDLFVVYNVRHRNFHYTDVNGNDLVLVGKWNSEAFQHKFKRSRKKIDCFRGAKIDLATYCSDFPFTYPGPNNTCPGFAFDILDILAAKFNFTHTWQDIPVDGKWGSKENGSWTGMFADLAYHNKSFIINNIELTWDRAAEFDSTYPYFSEGFSFMLKIPDPLPKWRGLLYPFTTGVWISIVITAIVVVALFRIAMSFMQPLTPHRKGFMQLVGSLVNQGYSYEVHGAWMHVWMLPWWFMCYVLCLAYTCNMVAFLTIVVPTKRIETIDELADSNLRVAIKDYGNYVPDALRESTDRSLAKIGARLELFGFDEEELFVQKKVAKEGRYAVINGESFNYYVRDLHGVTTQTYFMSEVLYPTPIVYYLPINTPQTELLSENLQHLVAAGLIRKLYKKHMLKEIPPDKEDSKQALELLTARRAQQGKNTFNFENLFVA